MLLMGAVFAVVLLGASFFATNEKYALALRFMAAIMFLAQPHQWLRELAAARQRFDLRGRELMLTGLVDFTAGLVLSSVFGLAGIAAATVVTIGLPCAYLFWRQRDAWKISWDWPRVRALMRTGIPFSLADSGFGLLRFMDLLVLAPMLGAVAAGHYQVSMLMAEFSLSIGNFALSQVIMPHLLKEYGRSGCLKTAAAFYEKPLRVISYVLPPLLALAAVLVEPAVTLLLPQYAPGVGAAQITVWSTFFLWIHMSLTGFFQAAEKYFAVLKLMAVLIPLSAAAQWTAARTGAGLEGVAWVSLSVLGITAASEIWIARAEMGEEPRARGWFILTLFAPCLLMLVLSQVLLAQPIPLLGRTAVLALIYTPVLFIYESKFSMLRFGRHTA
jgi:O-antigen/teichoic acid export membrane protein